MLRNTSRSAAPSPFVRLATCATLGLAVGCGGGGTNAPDENRKPDVVLIVVDTLRADRMSCYGYPRQTTPFLDSFAAGAVLFEDVTAQASWTLPSMVSMFTGHYLTEWRDRVPDGVPYLPEVFQDAGYRTVGLSANILINEGVGFARGFSHFDAKTAPPLPGDAPDRSRARNFTQLAGDLWSPLQDALRTDADGRRPPLFLYLQPFDPHAPYEPHPQYEATLPPASTVPVMPREWQTAQLAAHGPAPRNAERGWADELRRIHYERGLYDLEVRFTDEMLQRVFLRLEQLGVLKHAVVAILSDHGEGLWDRVSLLKPEKLAAAPPEEFFYKEHGAFLYQECVHTPFLLKAPGLPAGRRIERAVENIDLFPTLMELCDLPLPPDLDGRSLVGVARGDDGGPWRATVHSLVLPAVSVRELDTQLQLIWPLNPGGRFFAREPELYHLGHDPLQRGNLAARKPEEVARLHELIDRWMSENPTAGSSDVPLDPDQAQRMKDLGYTGDHTGGR